jgi:hypothetical protein
MEFMVDKVASKLGQVSGLPLSASFPLCLIITFHNFNASVSLKMFSHERTKTARSDTPAVLTFACTIIISCEFQSRGFALSMYMIFHCPVTAEARVRSQTCQMAIMTVPPPHRTQAFLYQYPYINTPYSMNLMLVVPYILVMYMFD